MTRLVGEENLAEKELPPTETSEIGAKNQGFSHYNIVSLWMAIVPIIGHVLWLSVTLNDAVFANSTGDAAGFVVSGFMISIPIAMISALFAIRALGKRFLNPMIISILIAIPLAIWEYFNELNNGTWCRGICPPDPPGYDLPRTIMLIYLIILGVYALSKYGNKEDQARTYGIAYGMGFGYQIYFLAFFIGAIGLTN